MPRPLRRRSHVTVPRGQGRIQIFEQGPVTALARQILRVAAGISAESAARSIDSFKALGFILWVSGASRQRQFESLRSCHSAEF